MVSCLLPTPSLLSPRSSSFLAPSPSLAHPSPLHRPKTANCAFGSSPLHGRQTHSDIRFPVRATAGDAALLNPCTVDVSDLKLKLLSAVSGLNRGLAANEDDLRKADAAAKDLEDAGGPVDLNSDLDKLQGRWRLVYSSAFSSRTLGGSRPGPPTGRLLPITLGQVFQRIDVLSKDFDNIVEIELGTPWPFPKADATAILAHKFEVIGSAKIKITFVSTTVKPSGTLSQLPPIEIPRLPDGLRPPSNTGTGDFDVTYVDSDMRITRGDKGELRVFVVS